MRKTLSSHLAVPIPAVNWRESPPISLSFMPIPETQPHA
tara:strand:+ start:181 stop:297 length:117 start_codon:yes stop_codon:yes gene_type:complete